MWTRLFRANAAYAFGSAANSAALFLLVPYLVNALSVSDYGAWSILEIVIVLTTMVVLAGMDVGLMRFYWFLENEHDRKLLSGTILITIVVWGSLISLTLFITYSLLRDLQSLSLIIGFLSPTIVLLVLGIGLIESIFSYLLNLFRIREQAVHFVSLSLGRMLLFLMAAILGVQITGNIIGLLAGRLIAGIIGTSAAIFFSHRLIAIKFDLEHFKKVVSYGLPLLPANGAAYILLASDRYILNIYSTLEIVAIYSFAYKIATVLDVMITRPFATDWAARRFKIAGTLDAPKKYANVLIIYLFVISFAALGILIFAPVLYRLIAPESYLEGIKVLPILLIALIIYGLNTPLNVGIVIKDKTHYAAGIGIFSALFCVIIELITIPKSGMVGAAWSTLISYAIWTGGNTYFSLRFYSVPYRLQNFVIIIGTVLLGYLGINMILVHIGGSGVSFWYTFLSVLWLILVFSVAGIFLKKNLQT